MAAILHPLGPGRQISVDRAVVLIGRSNDCDVILDTSTRISRIHCAVVQVNNEYFIRDLGSMNGVWCGGERVVRDLQLVNGLEIAIGDLRYIFLDNAASASRPQAVTPQSSGQPVPIRAVQILSAGASPPTNRPTPTRFGISGCQRPPAQPPFRLPALSK